MPAFIIAELRGQFGGFIDRLIYNSLGAPDFIDLLTPAQRHVIMACISFYGAIGRFDYDSSEISTALVRYANAGQATNKPTDRSGDRPLLDGKYLRHRSIIGGGLPLS